ncbi:MAG: hypothetical protein GTO14_10940, partial [Anaerolineales bacterium]|nr:hypothetical protein [Anaerolineales bacterium]
MDWTLITIDLSNLPTVDPDGDVDKDADDFYDIEGIIFGGWDDGTDAYIDGLTFEKAEDTNTPQYSDSSTSSTWAGASVEFRLRWIDNVGLSGYVFSFDNGVGAFANDTWIQWPISSKEDWSNVTKVVDSGIGKTIRWKVYANDTSNNWNASPIYSFVTTETPPATLSVDTTPVKSEVFVNDVSWGLAPQSNTVTAGTYTVSFSDVAGYVTPGSQIVTLVDGESRTVVGVYNEEEGTLSVDTTPVKGEVFVDGLSWGIAPQSRTVVVGSHTVSFGDFFGYDTPSPQAVTVVTGETASVLGTYEPAVVLLYPPSGDSWTESTD